MSKRATPDPPTFPWWSVPAAPLVRGMCADLRYGNGIIMRARLGRGVWLVDWCGSYRTLNDAAARRGFPADVGPNADIAATEARRLVGPASTTHRGGSDAR